MAFSPRATRNRHPWQAWLQAGGCLLAIACAGSPAPAVDPRDTRLLSEPDLSTEHIAFAYAGDLWIGPRDGGTARRLTAHPGTESDPRFSPDGSLVAFTGEYDGNVDVFIVPVSGGAPLRLTYHPGDDRIEGFTPDGRAVLFFSQRETFTSRHTQIFSVGLEGGFPDRLPIPQGLRADMDRSEERIAYVPTPERHQQWKNYRGGTVARIWIQSLEDHSVVEVPQPPSRSNDTDPVFVDGKLYFRSDRAGEFNIFQFDPSDSAIEQLTHFEDFPVLALETDGTSLVFEQAGYVHLLDLRDSGNTQRVKFSVPADLPDVRPRWVSGTRWIRGGTISPTGKRAALEFRGDIVTLPRKKGDSRNLTSSSDAHERDPAWSPDGSHIAYFSDQNGEYELHIAPQTGARGDSSALRAFALDGAGFYEDLEWSPDSRYLTYSDNSWALWLLDTEAGQQTKITQTPHYGPGGDFRPLHHAWSPDSRWLAYTVNTRAYVQQVFIYDMENGQSHAVSDGLSETSDPVFDKSGKYLYFLSSTDAGPAKHWFAMSNADVSVTHSVQIAVLSADEPSPLGPESDEEPDEESDDGSSEAGADETPETRIDFDGLDQRILSMPLAAGTYADLQTGRAGQVWYRRLDTGPNATGAGTLAHYDFDAREEKVIAKQIDGYLLSASSTHLLYVRGDNWGIADAGPKIDLGESRVTVDALRTRIDPRAEWQQIFDEVWRINRDYFYDPGMHGADWQAMAEKYAAFLPHVTSRADLNRVLQWMCSEIAVGHHRVGGGDLGDSTPTIPGGLLGADWEVDQNRYRLRRIYGGLNWNPELRAPLTEPGVQVREGDYLLAVDGIELTSEENLFARFEHTADRTVELRVASTPTGEDARTMNVRPIADEGALRNRAWVEGNLQKVHDATNGRVAYVYVPNTTTAGHTYFKRYFYPQVDKQALIVDERFNGGGQVADYYIDHLRRPLISWWATRYGDALMTPSASIQGPKVMLIDETAGSGGDLLPWMFRKLELGTLVGKRTWGGLVGTLGFPNLIDGGFVTAPNLAIWNEDGFIVENVGVPPDVEVEQWPADVLAGRDPQLEQAIKVVLEELERAPPIRPERPPFPIRARP